MDPLDEALRAAYSVETLCMRTYGALIAAEKDDARRDILRKLEAESARNRASVMVELERRRIRELTLVGRPTRGTLEELCDLEASLQEAYRRVARLAGAAGEERLRRWAESHEARSAVHVHEIVQLLGRA